MAIVLTTAAKAAAMGSTGLLGYIGNAAVLKWQTSGDADLVSFTLPTTSGAVSGGVLTLDFDPDINGTASGSGDVAKFRLYQSDGTTEVLSGTVTANGGGGDIETTSANVTIATSDVCTMTSLALTLP